MSEKKLKNKGGLVGERLPNIVLIYLDDLGIGDVSAYGLGKLDTPGIDRIAKEGIRFTDGYATSATCTPSRYALLTGEYPWRNERARILPGDAPLLIDPNRETLPKMLQKRGYATGIVGKWHLGLGEGDVDWNQPISPGPNEVGFDYSYIMAATNDRVPNVYVKNGSVVDLEEDDPLEVSYTTPFPGEPTGYGNHEMLKMRFSNGHYFSINNGISRIGYQRGGKAAQWIDEDMSDLFLNEAKGFVEAHKDEPFFLYYAMHQPHVPRVPNERFAGKSELGPRGDVILEADWTINDFLNTLDSLGLDEDTIVIFSSDNGPVLDDGYFDEAIIKNGDHTPWGIYRGGKYSLLEAGTRVPFMIRWKGKIEPSVSHAIVSQHDLVASLASLLGADWKSLDSEDLLDAFLGKTEQGRESMVIESARGLTAFRQGNWGMIPPHEGEAVLVPENIETGYSSEYQLYDLAADPGQSRNLAEEEPERLAEMVKAYRVIVEAK